MSYRDDHDAAIARADALQQEVDELKRELERKAAPAPAPARAPMPVPEPIDRGLSIAPPRRSRVGLIVVIAAVLAIAAGVVWLANGERQKRNAARAASRQRAADLIRDQQRTLVLGHLEPCIQETAWSEEERRQTAPATSTPSAWHDTSALGVECVQELDALLEDPAFLSGAGAAAIRRLREAEAPLQHGLRDPAQFARAVAERHAAFRDVDAVVLPQLRDAIAQRLETHASRHGHDVAWWTVHVRLAFWHLLDVALVASRLPDDGPVDLAAAASAARAPLDALLAEVAHAPPEIQAQVRRYRYFTDPILAGAPLPISALTLFVNNEMTIGRDTLVALAR